MQSSTYIHTQQVKKYQNEAQGPKFGKWRVNKLKVIKKRHKEIFGLQNVREGIAYREELTRLLLKSI